MKYRVREIEVFEDDGERTVTAYCLGHLAAHLDELGGTTYPLPLTIPIHSPQSVPSYPPSPGSAAPLPPGPAVGDGASGVAEKSARWAMAARKAGRLRMGPLALLSLPAEEQDRIMNEVEGAAA